MLAQILLCSIGTLHRQTLCLIFFDAVNKVTVRVRFAVTGASSASSCGGSGATALPPGPTTQLVAITATPAPAAAGIASSIAQDLLIAHNTYRCM